MSDSNLLTKYNYDEFRPEKFEPWMCFDESPEIGSKAIDFPLWQANDQTETSLSTLWSQHEILVVEFGSFT